MTDYRTLTLVVVFLVTSGISVITGSASLRTVPVMLQFGINPKTAVATNMLALRFMSVGGSIPFLRRRIIDKTRLPSSRAAEAAGVALTFVLGIYGGFFSGGYVTLLTALYVDCFRMQYLEAIAVTKLANVFS
jgi:uncharacterized membrane protein YfcA